MLKIATACQWPDNLPACTGSNLLKGIGGGKKRFLYLSKLAFLKNLDDK